LPASANPSGTVAVSVLYFAALRDLAGVAEESIALPSGDLVDVGALLTTLERAHEALRGRLGSVRVAVNEEFAPLTTKLFGGEVVALIPPVSGG
jgi:molybdopterin converting factor subunit 1